MKDMARLRALLCLLHLCLALSPFAVTLVTGGVHEFSRQDFPPDFVFGASTSAYQVEGAAFEDGRTPTIFDTFAHSGRLEGTGDRTADEYHKYKEDVQLMAETGLDAYRFSISWSRLIPSGRGPVNPKGLEYYNNLIDELISNGIQPHVTLLHSDVPLVLEEEYGGFLSPRIIEDFVAYADVCFREFGDRVLYWTIINEANIFVFGGYDAGNSPPCRCSSPFGVNCTIGDSTTEPYLAAHHILLSHASIARLYKYKYQGTQHGFVGFNVYVYDFIPFTNKTEDVIATRRAFDYFIGWFVEPLIYGEYPAIMKKSAGTRLPHFTVEESELLKGSVDFIGLNYYTVGQVQDNSATLTKEPRDYVADMAANWIYLGSPDPFGGEPFPNAAWGLQQVLQQFKQDYGNPPVFIHENGQLDDHNGSLDDQIRVEYLQGHIKAVRDAMRNGSNSKGYFVWSFLDMYELLYGYKHTFGLYYVNFSDPKLTRHPKLSQKWYSGFLRANYLSITDEAEDMTTTLQINSRRSGDVRGHSSS